MRIFGVPLFESVNQVEIKGEIPDFSGISADSDLWGLVASIRQVANDRKAKLKVYDAMALDATISTAMEMMAEDATQLDVQKNRVVWVECANKKQEKYINDFLSQVDVDSRIFSWAYAVVKQGELFLKTYKSDKERSRAIADKKAAGELTDEDYDMLDLLDSEYFYEEVPDPSTVYDIQRFGKTAAFFHRQGESGGTVYPPDDFIHFCSDRTQSRTELTLELPSRVDGNKKVKKQFKVRYGTSFIAGAVQAYSIVSLLEDVMILSRISRSSLFRIFSIDVGSAGKVETLKILRDVKNAIKNKERINPRTGFYKSDADVIPMADHIFVPTRQGKGDISVNPVGGDVDVRSVVDFDFFWNKLCGALKIPKAFLGFEDQLPGGIGNTSLTRLDIRYARTIKAIQTILRTGVRRLIELHMEGEGKPGTDFEVKMARINDAEESDRVKDMSEKTDAANALVQLLTAIPGYLDGVKPESVVDMTVRGIVGLDPALLKKKTEKEIAADNGDGGDGGYEDAPEPPPNKSRSSKGGRGGIGGFLGS